MYVERGKNASVIRLFGKAIVLLATNQPLFFHNKIIWCSMYNIESLSHAFDMSYVEYALSKS